MPRPKKPTALKVIEGNPGKRAVNKSEPRPGGTPSPPSYLTAGGRSVWRRVVASMPPGVYTAADESLITAYAEAVARHAEVVREFAANPLLLSEGSTGQKVENPLLKLQRAFASLIVTLGAKLGLDPVARQSLSTEANTSEDEFGIT